MLRIKITPEDIRNGLPPYCIYCGEPTEDVKEFVLERSKLKWEVILPHCDEHIITMTTVKYLMAAAMTLCFIVVTYLNGSGYHVLPMTLITLVLMMVLFVTLQNHWFPKAIYLSRKKQVVLRNIHPHFCEALLERKAEATDASD
jgi:hypothetical protein